MPAQSGIVSTPVRGFAPKKKGRKRNPDTGLSETEDEPAVAEEQAAEPTPEPVQTPPQPKAHGKVR